MFFFLSKIASVFTFPITWVFILLLWTWFNKSRRGTLLAVSIFTFYFFSNSFILDELLRQWEIKAVPLIEIKEDFDVGVVMGGIANYDIANERVNFNCSSDRLWQALQLYEKGKIKKILITSGSGSLLFDFKEAEFLKEFLVSIKFPGEDLIIEPESRNTHENAVFTARILKEQFPKGKFLLITSSYHLRRSISCFKKQGVELFPYSTDRVGGPRKFSIDHLIFPSIRALGTWQLLIHEWIGMVSYKIMGYC